MNDLIKQWDDVEIDNVREAMIQLYRLHGYKWTEKQLIETSTLFAREMASTGIPSKAVLGGIHKLKFEKLIRIDLHDVIEASKEKVEPQDIEREECDYCWGSGIISMRDENKYEFALRCTCKNGDAPGRRDLAQWNGELTQQRGWLKLNQNGKEVQTPRIFTLRFPVIL